MTEFSIIHNILKSSYFSISTRRFQNLTMPYLHKTITKGRVILTSLHYLKKLFSTTHTHFSLHPIFTFCPSKAIYRQFFRLRFYTLLQSRQFSPASRYVSHLPSLDLKGNIRRRKRLRCAASCFGWRAKFPACVRNADVNPNFVEGEQIRERSDIKVDGGVSRVT